MNQAKNEPPVNGGPTPASAADDPSRIRADRRRKLQRLRSEFQINPFGQRTDGLISLARAREAYDADADQRYQADPDAFAADTHASPDSDDRPADPRPAARVAGRIVAHREMGNLIFIKLRDDTGDLQINLSKKVVGQACFSIAKLAELSDIVTATGRIGTTKKGEVSLWVQAPDPADPEPPFAIACKTLAPPPGKYHGLADQEARYRKRYIDLYANPPVMRALQTRARIISEIRAFMVGRGFMEVETPMLQPIHGGAAARPFVTHHNALDMPLYLRIAPELYLKRLLVGGMRKVFEINRNFRNEGLSPRHNPEFTMLEAYEAFGNWETMAELVEELICTVAENVRGTLVIEHHNPAPLNATKPESSTPPPDGVREGATTEPSRTIDLRGPEANRNRPRGQRWPRIPMADLVEQRTGWRFNKHPIADADRDRLRREHPGKDLKLDGQPAEQLVEVYEKLVEPTLIDPCYVTRVPSVVIPLARPCEDDPYFADVYELAINGVEISPGYTELNDPDVQERLFREQVADEEERQAVDEDFLEALRVGMPPAGGIGIGIDRLVMLLTGAESIRDVIAFPLMRPESAT